MKSTLLGPNGKPLAESLRGDARTIQSSFDVQWTTNQNAQHWAMARSGDAQISFNYEARRTSRIRARYEAANNTHLRSMVDTKASDLVGCVTLQMLDKDQQGVEKAWNAWASEICLHDKLTQMIGVGKITDGEGLGLLYNNDHLYSPIKLDIMNFEPEQMGNQYQHQDDFRNYDGILHDKNYPQAYYVYDWNPDTQHRFNPMPYEGAWYDPTRVIHLYKRFRCGQLRGASELGPALEFAAICRRYTLAVLGSAENAAEVSMVMETDSSIDCPAESLDGLEGDWVPWVRNQMFTTPYGWKMKNLKPEQPVEQYHQFVRSIVVQMGRALGIPAVLCFGDSSEYNMASGRLDVQAYTRSLNAERKAYFEPAGLEKIFLKFMQYYAGFKSGMLPSDINTDRLRKQYPHRWTYQPINHSDPEKQAKADAELWQLGLLTDDEYLYTHNIDPESHYKQLEEQNKRRARLGMPAPGMMPGMPSAGQSVGPNQGNSNEQQQDSEETSSSSD